MPENGVPPNTIFQHPNKDDSVSWNSSGFLLKSFPDLLLSGDYLKNFFRESGAKEKYMALSKELLDILVCPQCKGEIELTPAQDGLICRACKLCYPIKDDIPVMLIDEAAKIN